MASSDRILVRMPDGAIVNAPRSATRMEIETRYGRMRRIEALKASNPGEYDPSSPDFRAKYGATSGMSGYDKVAANVGAGAHRLGLGLQQAATFSDEGERRLAEEIASSRVIDDELANDTRGGKFLQLAGEVLPTLAIPGGAVARGITALPKVGAAARGVGVGRRALPTLLAEGTTTGAALGALTPTLEDESTLANAAIGAVGGAALPAVGGTLGWLGRKYLPRSVAGVPTGSGRLSDRAVSRGLVQELGSDAAGAESKLAAYERRMRRGIDEPPMSTAMVTQNNVLGEKELIARASKDTSAEWGRFDEALANARWDVLDRNLGSAQSVDDAIEATRKFMDAEAPKYLANIKPKKFDEALRDFDTGLLRKLRDDKVLATPAARAVYGHIAATANRLRRHGYDWTPDTLWEERKTLTGWLQGRPPPGKEKVRAPKLDVYLMNARNAIDATLNRASNFKWSRFLNELGDRLGVEGSERAGQNIRNTFVDQVLNRNAKPGTGSGAPVVTENALREALKRHGKTDFGVRLNSGQMDAVETVLNNLESQGVLQRAKATITGRGGSHTAPLAQRLGESQTGGDITELLRYLSRNTTGRELQTMSDAMLSPSLALRLLKSGKAQLSPLTRKQLFAIAAGTRAAIPMQREAAEDYLTNEEGE